jgi:hypothetical protein
VLFASALTDCTAPPARRAAKVSVRYETNGATSALFSPRATMKASHVIEYSKSDSATPPPWPSREHGLQAS